MKNYDLKKRAAVVFLVGVLLLGGVFSSCKFESVAEYESRLAEEDSTVFIEELPSGTDEAGKVTTDEGAGAVESPSQAVSNPNGGGYNAPEKTTGEKEQNASGANSGQSGNAGGNVPKTTAPAEKNTSAEQPQSITVTIAISCANAVGNSNLNSGITLPADGVILANSNVTISQNTSVFDLLKSVCAQKKIPFLYQDSMFGKYVQKIGPIGEKDCGAQSGWTYLINGSTPPVSADGYKKLKNGDKITWVYEIHA